MPKADHAGAVSACIPVCHFADLELDRAAGTLTRDGVALPLPRLSWRLLLALVDAAPAVLDQEELLERVWKGRVVSGETVTQRIKLLRQALGDDAGSPRYIGLVRGRGYRLLPEVRLAAQRPRLPHPNRSEPLPRPSRRPLAWGGSLALAALLGLGINLEAPSGPDMEDSEQQALERTAGQAAMAVDAARAEAAFRKGRHYYNRRLPGDFARARDVLSAALALDPSHVDARVTLAASYYIGHYQHGGPEEAEALDKARAGLRRALEIDPAHGRAHARMGHVLQALGEPVAAAQHYRLARVHGGDDALVLAITAGHYMNSAAFEEAAELLRQATQLEPLTRAYRVNLTIVLLANGQLDAAERELAEYRNLFPEDSHSLIWEETLLLLLRGQHQRALQAAHSAEQAAERLALIAMAARGAAQLDIGQRALAELEAADGLSALVRGIQANAYLGNVDKTEKLLRNLEALGTSGQLSREMQRSAWSELMLSPVTPAFLRTPVERNIRSLQTVAMLDS